MNRIIYCFLSEVLLCFINLYLSFLSLSLLTHTHHTHAFYFSRLYFCAVVHIYTPTRLQKRFTSVYKCFLDCLFSISSIEYAVLCTRARVKQNLVICVDRFFITLPTLCGKITWPIIMMSQLFSLPYWRIEWTLNCF